jgi:hypothetical protein
MTDLLNKKLLKNSQHVFMPKISCTTNLLEFLEKVTSMIDGGEPMDVIIWMQCA